jgi:hypothetical protein
MSTTRTNDNRRQDEAAEMNDPSIATTTTAPQDPQQVVIVVEASNNNNISSSSSTENMMNQSTQISVEESITKEVMQMDNLKDEKVLTRGDSNKSNSNNNETTGRMPWWKSRRNRSA